MVTEFILTDGGRVKPNIAPSAFLHIAKSLEPNSCLLPSLLRLCITDADTYLPYLHLLHTPSLKTLEATNVPDRQHPSFFSFLTTLVHKVPLLENIILGPGRFPLKSLQVILKFAHLHQLELRDVVSTIDFTFLQDVGNLPNLECLILDARSCEYVARIPEDRSVTPLTEHMAEAGSRQSADINSAGSRLSADINSAGSRLSADINSAGSRLSADINSAGSRLSADINSAGSRLSADISNARSADINSDESFGNVASADSDIHIDGPFTSVHPFSSHPYQPIPMQTVDDTIPSTSTMGGFHQLKRFHVVGKLSLIQGMIPYIASNTLEDISITLIRLSHRDLNQKAEEQESTRQQIEIEERRRRAEEEMHYQPVYNWGTQRVVRLPTAGYQRIEERWKAEIIEKAAQTMFDLHTASYITLLQTVSSRWSSVLKVVKINQLDRSSQPLPMPPALPKQVYKTLLRHPRLEILDCKRWKLDSVKDFLLSLKSSRSKNLKQLHLPIDGPNPAVPLSGLLDIAKAFPMLESLQCCIDKLSPIPQYPIPTTSALSHGLQTLIIANNPTSHWDFNELLLVTRHLYLMFPNIQTIDNVEGPKAEQWVCVRELVEMFQTIHKDDLYRFS